MMLLGQVELLVTRHDDWWDNNLNLTSDFHRFRRDQLEPNIALLQMIEIVDLVQTFSLSRLAASLRLHMSCSVLGGFSVKQENKFIIILNIRTSSDLYNMATHAHT